MVNVRHEAGQISTGANPTARRHAGLFGRLRMGRRADRKGGGARRAPEIAVTWFEAGLADFLIVREARRTADASGEQAAAAVGRARRAQVLLWQTLGGEL